MQNIIDSKITLKNHLSYDATEYIFTLTLSVNDFYKKKIGNPDMGVATIIVKYHKTASTIDQQSTQSTMSLKRTTDMITSLQPWYFEKELSIA